MVDVKDILKKYGGKIESQIGTSGALRTDYSQEYIKFNKI